jgi:integrase
VQGLKSGRRRSYSDIDSRLWNKLCRYVKKKVSLSSKESFNTPLFPVTTQTAKNAFKRIAKLAGLNDSFSIHALRHSCGMLMAKRGDSIIRIMLWLRHKSVQSTWKYVEQTQFEKDGERQNELMSMYL